jgi:hypothetical protein
MQAWHLAALFAIFPCDSCLSWRLSCEQKFAILVEHVGRMECFGEVLEFGIIGETIRTRLPAKAQLLV